MLFTRPLTATIVAAACVVVSGCGQQSTPDTVAATSPFPDQAKVTGTLSCERFEQWDAFEKPVALLIAGTRITTEDLGVEPVRNQFETWAGQIEGNQLTLAGRYKHPDQKSPRPVNLGGEYVDGQIRLEGTRGPRKCTYISTAITPQS